MTTLIRGGCVLPLTERGLLWDAGSVLFDGEQILAVGPDAEVAADPRAAQADIVDAIGCAVVPGLHNCHLHSGLLRGTAESLSLWDWLTTFVDPAHKALTPAIAEAASRQCYAESVLAGTTSVMDMWRFMEGSAAAAGDIGLRATLVPYVADEPGYDYFETIETNRSLLEACRSAAQGRIRAWVGLEHLLYCRHTLLPSEPTELELATITLIDGEAVHAMVLMPSRLQPGDKVVDIAELGGFRAYQRFLAANRDLDAVLRSDPR